jgi:2-dehydro-3-deoxygluconokinase
MIRRELTAEGVTVIARDDTRRATGLMIKDRRSVDRTDVLYYRANSAASALEVDDIPRQVIEDAHIVHLSGITPALSESCHEVVRYVAALAARYDTPLSVDINYRQRLWSPDKAVAVLSPIVEQADLVFASLHEAELFTVAGEAERTARELTARSAGIAVIKLGDQGAMAYADGLLTRRPAVPINPVDTVGAGDAFVAGYLSAFLRGKLVGDSLELGNLCGASACAVVSDWQGAPTTKDIADARTPLIDAVHR